MTEHITIPRAEYVSLAADAEAWRGVAQWAERYGDRQGSWDIAAQADWRTVARQPWRYRTPRVLRCDWRSCTADGTPHRSPASGAAISLCPTHSHLGIAEDAPARMEVAA